MQGVLQVIRALFRRHFLHKCNCPNWCSAFNAKVMGGGFFIMHPVPFSLSLAKATCLNPNLLAVVAFLSPSWGCERSLFDSLLPAFSIYLLGPYTPRSWPNRGTVLGYPIMGLCTPRLWPSTGSVLEPPTHSFKINYYDNQNPYQTYSKYV